MGNIFKRGWKNLKKGVGHLDITSTTSTVGRAIGKRGVGLARQAIGTAATGLTGGLAAVDPKIRRWALEGYKTGAVVGAAIGAGKGIAGATQAGLPQFGGGEPPPPLGGPTGTEPPVTSVGVEISPVLLIGAAIVLVLLVKKGK